MSPKTRRQIIDLAKQRLSNAAISERVGQGIKPSYVATIVSAARRDGEVIPYAFKAYERLALERQQQGEISEGAETRQSVNRGTGLLAAAIMDDGVSP